jgi:uncharacterized protein YuzE
MSVQIAGIEFDKVVYDAPVDVLYVNVEGKKAVDWDESAEGDGLSYGSDGSLVGMTVLNARRRLERDGKIVITLPEQQVEATDLGDALVPA